MSDVDALLAQMRDVHAPAVSLWPAPGWWLLAVLLLLLFILARQWRQRRRRLVWKREAQQELASLRSAVAELSASATLVRCSALARRLLLVAEPRAAVAGLQGEAWLLQLDEICQQALFSQGAGRLLLDGQYQRDPEVNSTDLALLFTALDTLINNVQRRLSSRSVIRPGVVRQSTFHP